MADQRVGTAFDAHRLVAGRPLVLGGVTIPFDRGLDGHSDADIVCHVLCDAALGAAGLGDIGRMFPGTPFWKGASSLDLLGRAWRLVADSGWRLGNADCMVIAQAPPIAPHVEEMRALVAEALGSTADRVSIRGTSTDGLGFTGRGEGIAAQAVASVSGS